ncbi:nucleoside hydrolase [Sulfobacillus harzensis]|uniref:Nucleoside hydrolase n=1 Tax=Sulfobacillus harzensis TaxID=2729629 RepID=A0A7Y0Q0C8_9FIRM|nr:nucleoside hydrolase [Sulfobacillus harzensis]NMP20868.1 nucleoside hydrolase [Sulfobacillus harzensis]
MDPGIDDAWALAIARSRCHVVGVSAVAGNVALPHTFGNAQRLMEVLHLEVPLLAGAEHPILGPLITAEAFHGPGGVGEWEGRTVQVPREQERVWTYWASHLEEWTNVHIVATGPLTNLAIALMAHSPLATAFASVTCMCGALPGAQVDKAQEFNVYVDPHAADAVFHWVTPLQLIGINVAHKALIPVQDVDRLNRFGEVGKTLHRMLGFYSQRSRGEGGNPEAFPIDDVVAVAAVSAPELFRWREMPLAVVREGPLRGTVVISPVDVKRPPVKVAVDIDVAGFRDWVWDSMAAFSEA